MDKHICLLTRAIWSSQNFVDRHENFIDLLFTHLEWNISLQNGNKFHFIGNDVHGN